MVEFHRDCWTLQKSAVLDIRLDKVHSTYLSLFSIVVILCHLIIVFLIEQIDMSM